MKKSIIPILMSLAMAFTMMPMMSGTVYAATPDAINLVDENGSVSGLTGAQGSSIWFGNYKQSGDSKEPVKWRLLKQDVSSGQLLLLSDQNLDCKKYNEIWIDMSWEQSTIRAWLNGTSTNGGTACIDDYDVEQDERTFDYTNDNFIDTAFSSDEQAAIATTTIDGGNDTDDKIFLLSVDDAHNEDYGFTSDYKDTPTRKAKNTDYAISQGAYTNVAGNGYWWLRSPGYFDNFGYRYNYAADVSTLGLLYYNGFQVDDDDTAVRPAFNLNLKSVILISAAAGGKSSGAAGGNALTAVSANTTNEWKLTLHDSGRDGFDAEEATGAVLSQDEGYTSWNIPVVYSGASTANDNDYVSVILADSSDNALYYGNISKKTAASSDAGQEVTIPAGLAAGDYKLYVFSEQINGDKLTDYASAFTTINLTVNAKWKEIAVPTGKTLTYNGKAQTGVAAGTGYTLSGTTFATNAGSYQATATLDEGYAWSDGSTATKTIKWTIKAKAITPAVTLSATAYTYNGKVRKPTVTVKDGSTKLAASQYTLTYASGRKNVGSYKVTVKMKGNYSGSKAVSFKINPKGTTLSEVTKAKKAATVKWKKQAAKMSASRITGYQIQLATNSKFTKNKKTVNVKGYSKISEKVTGLKGGKKYWVRIRTYKKVGSTTYYSPWSKVKTVTTGK